MEKINQANTYLFDLDDTLYSPDLGILKQVETRMHHFISDALSMPLDEATQLSNHYYQKFGGTVKGLVKYHNISREDFIHHCHDVDLTHLQPEPHIITAINELAGRKIIYTNSPKHYAKNILSKLQLADSFENIFSLEDASYHLKPHANSYDALCQAHDIDTNKTVFFDDQLRNLAPAKKLGMTTVWISGGEQVVANTDYDSDYEAANLQQFFQQLKIS